jgi:peptidyl-prolyl cis-trans isomerase D
VDFIHHAGRIGSMLYKLRENTKPILIIAIVAFVGMMVAVWGMNLQGGGGPESGVIGRVDGQRITVNDYRNELANQRASYYEQRGQRPDTRALRNLEEQTWESLVQQYLLWQEAEERGFMPTDQEVLMEIQSNPPAFVRAQPVFQTDSTFDHSKYLNALGDPSIDPRFKQAVEGYVRSSLPLQKLQEYMMASVRVTDAEAMMLARMAQEKAVISYVAVDPQTDVKAEIPEPGEPELLSYYQEHTEDFRIPEKRVLNRVSFPKTPSAEDERYALEKIQEAYDLIQAGEPFDEIALDYSDDPFSGPRGGDMGWATPGQVPSKLDSVVQNLETGEMSEIVETTTGYHLVRVDDRRVREGKDEVKLSYIVSRLEASPYTLDRIERDALELAEAARDADLVEAAAENAFESDQSQELTEGEIRTRYGLGAPDAADVFKARLGAVIGPAEGTDAFHVLEVARVIPSRIPEFEEVADRVRQSYLLDRKRGLAGEIAASVEEGVESGLTLEQAASREGLQVVKTEPFTRNTGVPMIGRRNIVIASAFVLPVGTVSGVLESSGRFYILRVDEVEEFDQEQFQQMYEDLRYQVLASKQQAYLGRWYQQIKDDARIEDYRTLAAGP